MFLLLFAELVWSLQFLVCKMLFLVKFSWKPMGLCWCSLHECRENNRREKPKMVQSCSSMRVQQPQGLNWTLQPTLVSDLSLHLSHFLPEDEFSSIIPLSFCGFCSPRGCSGCGWPRGFVVFDISRARWGTLAVTPQLSGCGSNQAIIHCALADTFQKPAWCCLPAFPAELLLKRSKKWQDTFPGYYLTI